MNDRRNSTSHVKVFGNQKELQRMWRFLLILTVISFAGWGQPTQSQAQGQRTQSQAQPPIVVQVMPPTQDRGFLGWLQGFGPLIAAAVAAGVGAMQWHLQKKHLMQNLFDKRYRVYAATDAFLANVLNGNGLLEVKATRAFQLETAHAEFLFGDDVTDFIALVYQRALELALVSAQIRIHDAKAGKHTVTGSTNAVVVPTTPLSDLLSSKTELVTWLDKTQARRNSVFDLYLRLDRELPWYARWERDLNLLIERLDKVVKQKETRPSVPRTEES